MGTHPYLDASPPAYNGAKDVLDKSNFRKTLSVLAARVPPSKTGQILKAQALKTTLMDLPKIRGVASDPQDPNGDRLVLLRISKKTDISREAEEYLEQEAHGLVDYKIDLDYDYWTADDIMQTVLPKELRAGAPSGFAMTGHIAHVNLLDEYLPYKYLIGQLILDKNKKIKTVVNKLNAISNQFRVFKMEMIAGEPDYVVEHHESDCRFTFDFSQVYWNSRLHTEHERLVRQFDATDVVADVFAGVGPFAVPAARKGCAVLANDLNPASYRFLEKNIQDNRVAELVRASCEDGREFIRSIARRVYEDPFAAFTGPPLSRTQQDKEKRRVRAQKEVANAQSEVDLPNRNRIGHFVMNLPDSAIEFLSAFRGILAADGLKSVYKIMPMVHCHCFTRELEPEKVEADIRQRVEEQLGGPLEGDVSLHLVRSVAPNKEMYCISFRLPASVAFCSAT